MSETEGRNRSIHYGFIGLGQGGGRLAASFARWNYPVLAINTSLQDLEGLHLDDDLKLAIGDTGAGKNMQVADSAVRDKAYMIREKVYDTFCDKRNKPTIDRIILCIGSGGGTGSGSLEGMVSRLEECGFSGKIGVLMTLPMSTEDSKSKINTLKLIQVIVNLIQEDRVAPVVVMDNDKIKERYPGISVSQFWEKANNDISKIFHLFNVLTFKSSDHTSLDPADYDKIVGTSGFIVFGRSYIKKEELNKDTLNSLIDAQVSQRMSLLAGGFDVFRAINIGAIFVGKPELMKTIPMELLESAFDHMNDMVGRAGTLFRGVYSTDKVQTEGMELLLLFAGVDTPAERIHQLKEEATREKQVIQKKVEATSVEDIIGDIDELESD
jgi:cell division GTPase FtsZ